ncbi:MAG: hypothetical protein V4611_04485 [Patescibacteria group bacterium]
MNSKFYVGSYKDDAQNEADIHHGWIVGTFMENAPRKNENVEIKYWELSKGDNQNHDTKISSSIECTFILKGMTKCIIDNEEIILRTGDYIVIQPNTTNNTVSEILEDTSGLTIKSPSDPSAKTVLK